MKRIFTILFLLVFPRLLNAQLSSCTNADFEQNSFVNWVAKTGSCCPISMFATGVVTGQHTIMSGAGTDPHTNNTVSVVAPGGLYSARLGNDNIGAEGEQLIYSFTVTPTNQLFIYRYAVVLEDPLHDPIDQPRFEIRVYDQTGGPVGCGTYNVVSGAGIPGFVTWTDPSVGDDVHYKDWTTVGIDLSGYTGQTLTIEFSTGDCALGGHFGYAYVDAYCSPLTVSSDYCPNTNTSTLIAPPGFASYLWSNGATTQTITIPNPVIGTQYQVTMTSVTGCQVTLTQVIAVTNIQAHFTPTIGCLNGTNFIDSSYVVSGSTINTWEWNFGDGGTSSLQNPSHAFANAGLFPVTLIVTNAGNCKDTTTINVNITPAPDAAYTVAPGCPGTPIVFTDNSAFTAGTITDWAWSFGDGSQVSNVQNPSHTYTGAGPYNVLLTITGDNGCTDTLTQAAAPKPKPVADFNFNVACLNNQVSFTDASTLAGGNVIAWEWDFGDLSPVSILENPTHNYAAGGTYTVTLIVIGDNGCRDTVTKSVAMAVYPNAFFSLINSCANQHAVFTDLSTLTGGAISAWHWYFGDGASSLLQNPTHVYTTSGNYTVSLVATGNNGCSDSLAVPIVIKPSPVAAFGATTVCPGQAATFTDQSTFAGGTVTAWSWDFGDGTATSVLQNPTHTYTAGGSYNVIFVAGGNNGCTDSLIQQVNTSPTPVSSFTAPTGCEDAPILFASTSTISSGSITTTSWNFGDGSPVATGTIVYHTFPSNKSYNVYLTTTSNQGCTHTIFHEVTVSPKPVAYFSVPSVCESDSSHFTDLSTVAAGFINNWNWNFGDGSAHALVPNPVHLYADSGLYEVTLIVRNSLGCLDTVIANYTIKSVPSANFTTGNTCINAPVQFNDLSTHVGGSVTGWSWDFGNGNFSSQQNPVTSYSTSGTATVNLTVTASNGCTSDITNNITVNPQPTALFTSVTGCVNSPITLFNTSVPNAGTISSNEWNFGDGSSNIFTIHGTHIYSSPGFFPVTLITTTSLGCLDTTSATIEIYNVPQANFSTVPTCQNQTVVFNDLSLSQADSLLYWNWDYGDGTSHGVVQNVMHNYAASGMYNATLIVVNNGMCRDTVVLPVEVKPLPQIAYTTNNACANNVVQFTDASTLQGGTIALWNWDLDDGATSAQQHPSHTYLNFGTYNIQLIATGSNGCIDTLNQSLIVNRLPVASFIANNICEQVPLSITDQSYLTGGSISNWQWTMGDGTTDTVSNPVHTYLSDGTFPIHLTITASNGCVYDSTVSITVYDKPVAAFSNTNPCQFGPVAFIDLSSVISDTLSAWNWTFGDGGVSNLQNPAHTYVNYQQYNVQLIITSGYGCIDTVSTLIDVYAKPTANFSSANVCLNDVMYFNNSSTVPVGAIQQWNWNFGDTTSSWLTNPSHLYSSAGNFNIQLVVTTNHLCADTIIKPYTVYHLPIALFGADTTVGCQPFLVDFADSSSSIDGSIVKWDWDFGEGVTDTVSNPDVYTYWQHGYYDITLMVETNLGCRDTLLMPQYITVFPKPRAAFVTEPTSTSILYPLIDIVDQSIGAVQWMYNFGDSTTSELQNPQHYFPAPAQYLIMQYVTSSDGCRDTSLEYVDIQNDASFYVPNTFTPNNDGKNDEFNAYGIGITDFKMQVFNRWGQLLFISDSMEKGWDGTYNNKSAQQDVYIYTVTAKDIFNKSRSLKGYVTLLR